MQNPTIVANVTTTVAHVTTEVTMTSLELVEYINSQRKEGESELRHDHFMAKVPQVLGENGAPNFRASYKSSQNKELPCYRFPKREACLMAMSYSYDLQAKVFDRMTAMEQQVINVIKLPQNYIEALEHLLVAKKSEVLAIAERDEAIRTKAQISDKKTATAMAKASVVVRELKELKTAYLIPTQITNEIKFQYGFNVPREMVNKLLADIHLQHYNAGKWILSDRGLKHHAHYDPTPGMFNRILWKNSIIQLVAEAAMLKYPEKYISDVPVTFIKKLTKYERDIKQRLFKIANKYGQKTTEAVASFL